MQDGVGVMQDGVDANILLTLIMRNGIDRLEAGLHEFRISLRA